MPSKTTDKSWGAFALIFLIGFILHAFVPALRAGCYAHITCRGLWVSAKVTSDCSCSGANVKSHVWTACNSGSNPMTWTVTKNDQSTLDIWLKGYGGPFCLCETVPVVTFSDSSKSFAALEKSDNGFNWHWTLSNPQQDGTVIIRGLVIGDNTQDCNEYVILATIMVVKQNEDNTSSCTCSSQNSFGSGAPNNNSVDFKLGLGPIGTGLPAGYISLKIDVPPDNISLSDRSLLRVPFFGTDNARLACLGNSNVAQVCVPDGLVTVTDVTGGYRLDCYPNGSFYQFSQTTYAANNGAQPISSWTIVSPDEHQLTISDMLGRTYSYVYREDTEIGTGWVLTNPDGTIVANFKTFNADNTYTMTKYVWAENAAVLSKTQKKYAPQTGTLVSDYLLSVVEGDGAATRTTTYDYTNVTFSGYTNAYILRFGVPYTAPIPYVHTFALVQRQINADGSWKYYVYDSLARVIDEYT
jgi:hypothetical protein